MSDLDRMLAAWLARTVQTDLSQIEPGVWARLTAKAVEVRIYRAKRALAQALGNH